MPEPKSSNFIIHNGELEDVREVGLNPRNRAFLFGDGLFEERAETEVDRVS